MKKNRLKVLIGKEQTQITKINFSYKLRKHYFLRLMTAQVNF